LRGGSEGGGIADPIWFRPLLWMAEDTVSLQSREQGLFAVLGFCKKGALNLEDEWNFFLQLTEGFEAQEER